MTLFSTEFLNCSQLFYLRLPRLHGKQIALLRFESDLLFGTVTDVPFPNFDSMQSINCWFLPFKFSFVCFRCWQYKATPPSYPFLPLANLISNSDLGSNSRARELGRKRARDLRTPLKFGIRIEPSRAHWKKLSSWMASGRIWLADLILFVSAALNNMLAISMDLLP